MTRRAGAQENEEGEGGGAPAMRTSRRWPWWATEEERPNQALPCGERRRWFVLREEEAVWGGLRGESGIDGPPVAKCW
jgi:hypothetical protein